MRRSVSIILCLLLTAALSSPAWAGHGKGKGNGNGGGGVSSGGGGGGGDEPGESQAGGLPALEDRVEADEALIATLMTQVATLMSEVTVLQGQVLTLQGQVAALQTAVADLQGQNNWAVVNSTGTIARASSAAVTMADVHVPGSGVYEINFGKDVSKCAYQATIGSATGVPVPPPSGLISVAGDTDADSPNDVSVQTFSFGGVPFDLPFHLTVTCP